MFESVEQLEREIKEFQKNILASTEFVQQMEGILAAVRSQTNDFAARSSQLSAKMDSEIDAIRSGQSEVLAKLMQGNDNLRASLSSQTDMMLNELKEANQKQLSNTIDALKESQKDSTQKIEEAETAIMHCESELSLKYNEFLAKFESTNIDQMFKQCKEISRSINFKLMLLLMGVGVSIVLLVIQLLLK